MKPQALSEGILRFLFLATALLQPTHLDTITIDEPELGLHPTAIAILAELMQARATDTQLIVATQSQDLINFFLGRKISLSAIGRKGSLPLPD